MKINEKMLLTLLFISMVGICTGAFFEINMEENTKKQFTEILGLFFADTTSSSSDLSFFSCLLKSLKGQLVFLISALLAPFILITSPLLPLIIFFQGLASGFSAAIILEVLGSQGIINILLLILPVNLIRIPAYAFLSCSALQICFSRAGTFLLSVQPAFRRKRKALHQDARTFFLLYSICAGVIIFSCLLEAFLHQSGF